MTVKRISEPVKLIIVRLYLEKKFTQKELADYYLVSARTINRVLIEAGVATPVARIKGEAYQAMCILKKHGLAVSDLDAALQQLQSNQRTAPVRDSNPYGIVNAV